MIYSDYEMVCGIEIHVQLNTKTKLFCDCSTKFGSRPNSQCCPICLGMPGTLPIINQEAIEKALTIGLATNCKINLVSEFDRKNYFYPDLPKAYQLTQYYNPILCGGQILIESDKIIRIRRIHIEEDAGKIINDGNKILVDYNRSGIPLIEIVSEPDINSSIEAKQYVEKVQMLMRYLEVSDCKMQEGSMRCDVNISVRKKGERELGVPVEIKNINSKNFVRKALDFEFKRQVDILVSGKKVLRETRRYDEKKNITQSIREKELESDYRYFRDPDLPRVVISNQKFIDLKNQSAENFDEKFKRYVNDYKIPYQNAKTLLKYKKVSNFFERSIENVKDKRIPVNLIIGTMFSKLHNEEAKERFEVNISPDQFAEIITQIETNQISKDEAKNKILNVL